MIAIDEIRRFALSLPEAVEVDHWGKPSFRVNKKIFAVMQEDGVTLTVKTTSEERELLTSISPDTYRIPESFSNMNYMHVHIGIVDPEELRGLLLKAWSGIAPKRAVKAYEGRIG